MTPQCDPIVSARWPQWSTPPLKKFMWSQQSCVQSNISNCSCFQVITYCCLHLHCRLLNIPLSIVSRLEWPVSAVTAYLKSKHSLLFVFAQHIVGHGVQTEWPSPAGRLVASAFSMTSASGPWSSRPWRPGLPFSVHAVQGMLTAPSNTSEYVNY